MTLLIISHIITLTKKKKERNSGAQEPLLRAWTGKKMPFGMKIEFMNTELEVLIPDNYLKIKCSIQHHGSSQILSVWLVTPDKSRHNCIISIIHL